MCSGTAILNVLGSVFLSLAIGFCGAGFFSPNWIDMNFNKDLEKDPTSVADFMDKAKSVINTAVGMAGEGLTTGRIVLHQGLLARCFVELLPALVGSQAASRCQWFWMDNFEMEQKLPSWHYAAQGLYVLACLLLAVSLLMTCCCRCCSTDTSSLSTATGALALVASLLLIGSLAVFGTFQYREGGIRLPAELSQFDPDGTIGSGRGRFAWGSYMVIAAIVCGIVAAILLLCSGGKRRRYSRGDDFETARMISVNY